MTLAVTLLSPVDGRVVALSDVPDPVFAEGILGPGLAVEPPDGAAVEVRAPVSGRVVAAKPHALVIAPPGAPEKVGVLVHLGIDTVGLKGEGFTVHAGVDDEVAAGDVLVTWDTSVAAGRGLSVLCPLVVFSVDPAALDRVAPDGAHVAAGEPLAVLRLA